ncbi:MAG: magnesium chelatase [Chloroflexi bacterium]|nr:magnesium chelatase [Chloroflexota bacterium]
MSKKASTIGELRTSDYKLLTVKEEMRKNLIAKIRGGDELFPGIIGFEESVIPQLENAILSGQDIIFLGERGQAKSRLIRSLVALLDDEIPAIAGCEINDNPFDPICRRCADVIAGEGDDVEIEWIDRERRYGEKLATPDITIADLIGEVDPIKVAEGRYLSDELTIHYGLVPRHNRGIFSINELPDLAERIQVGLLNIMEERDVQIRGYRIRMPLDVFVVASANPEDYTNRGRIITPLKDRYGAQIRTHYPKNVESEIAIMEQEHTRFDEDADHPVNVPLYMKEIVAEITRLARRSPDINQRSGVSVRASITDFESLLANALRRAIRLGENEIVPRVSDLPYLMPSLSGKLEFETVEEGREEQIIERLIQGAVLAVFNRYFSLGELEGIVARFKGGFAAEVSDTTPSQEYLKIVNQTEGMEPALEKLGCGESPPLVASAVEFILEGLHLNKRLNKDKVAGRVQYRG